jgi:hypothetical protein
MMDRKPLFLLNGIWLTGRVSARLPVPVGGVAPGQVLAVYEGDECLGSGKIRDTKTLGDEK